jgi:hypothetical protein
MKLPASVVQCQSTCSLLCCPQARQLSEALGAPLPRHLKALTSVQQLVSQAAGSYQSRVRTSQVGGWVGAYMCGVYTEMLSNIYTICLPQLTASCYVPAHHHLCHDLLRSRVAECWGHAAARIQVHIKLTAAEPEDLPGDVVGRVEAFLQGSRCANMCSQGHWEDTACVRALQLCAHACLLVSRTPSSCDVMACLG